LRVIVDTAELRRTHAGKARWINGLVKALDAIPDLELLKAPGPRRVGGGLLFRPVNVTLQRWWYDVGIRREAKRRGADAMLMPGAYASSRGAIPQLVAILDVNYLTQPGTYEPLFTRYARWSVTRAARNADGLMTISAFSRSEISRHLGVDPERISVVYPGLDRPPDGTFAAPLDRPYALYVGATEKHKNVGLLLDAWEKLDGSLTLAIVGRPGRDHAELAARAANSGGKVLLVGSVDQTQLEAWYRNAVAFLFPSLAEGFGYPPLEAMQRGVPVIASRAGSLPEVLGDAAAYFDPNDPEELASRISEVVADGSLRASMASKGLAQAAKYNWADAAAATAGLLEGLVHRG
jgi:glycosyltransferase involved in cell wall biosynthesis